MVSSRIEIAVNRAGGVAGMPAGQAFDVRPYRLFDALAWPLGRVAHGPAVGKRTARSRCAGWHYPPITIKVLNEAARALTSMR
jgi:hypothetical protein